MKFYLIALLTTLFFSPSLTNAQWSSGSIAEKEQKNASSIKNYDVLSLSSNNYDVHYYRCEWEVDPAVRFITGKVTMHFTITVASNNLSLDLNTSMTVDSIYFRNAKTTFTHSAAHQLLVNFLTTLPASAKDSITIFYKGIPNASAFSLGTHGGIPALATVSEPYGARTWWPCKDVLKDKADSVDIIITNPSAYRSASNGIATSDIISGGKRTIHWKHRYPIECYLVVLAVTNYEVTNDAVSLPSRVMPVILYTFPESTATFLPAHNLAKSRLFVFGGLFSEYPFSNEVYAQTQGLFGGGMEHQTNSLINNPSAGLVVHELGHQWFGDKVTCGSWSDLWLNEGFATYCEYIHTEVSNASNKLPQLNEWRTNIISDPSGSVYVTDTLNVGRLFNFRLTYLKGGYVVHMLRNVVGDNTFFNALRNYLNDPLLAYKTAITPDLKRHMEIESGKNLTEFFNDWIYGQGFPNYAAQWSQSTASLTQLVLGQSTSHSSVPFFEMPVPVQFKSATRDTTIVFDHTMNNQYFEVNLGFMADVVVIDPQLSILTGTKTATRVASLPTSVPVVENGENLKIFPNPVQRKLNVSIEKVSNETIQLLLINSVGQIVLKKNYDAGTKNITVDVNAFPKGSYVLQIKSGRIDSAQKLVIE